MDDKKGQHKDIHTDLHPYFHSIPVQIRFNDIDSLGHVNNTIYFHFFDLGKANYFATVLEQNVDWKNVNIVVANINCDFCAPVYFHEKIAVETKTTHIYDKSFIVKQRIINTETGEVKCICSTTMVGFDTQKGVSAPLKDEWKSALENYEHRELLSSKK